MIGIAIALWLAGQSAAEPETLSTADRFVPIDDAALLAVVQSRFDPHSDPRKWIRAVGIHHGVKVVASYVCSDVCPDYTRRIIRYNVWPGAACKAAGGVAKELTVPEGIGTGQRLYCLPAVTAPYQ